MRDKTDSRSDQSRCAPKSVSALDACRSGTSTQTYPAGGSDGASGLKGDVAAGSRLSNVSTACTKPTAAIAQTPQKSKGLTVMGRHRTGQSGAAFLPPLTECQARELEAMRERTLRIMSAEVLSQSRAWARAYGARNA